MSVEKMPEQLLEHTVDRIVEFVNPDKIFLFGSFAYGTPKKDSDIDLLIIMETDERPAQRRIQISRLFKDRQVAMDFIVKTPSEIAERISIGDFFIKKILEQGKILYEKQAD